MFEIPENNFAIGNNDVVKFFTYLQTVHNMKETVDKTCIPVTGTTENTDNCLK